MTVLILVFPADTDGTPVTVHTYTEDETTQAGRMFSYADEYTVQPTVYIAGSDGKVHSTELTVNRGEFDEMDYATVTLNFLSVDSKDEYVCHYTIDGRS